MAREWSSRPSMSHIFTIEFQIPLEHIWNKPTNVALLIYSVCEAFFKSLISKKAAVIDSKARLVEDTFDFGTEDPAVLSRFIENQSNVENTIYHGFKLSKWTNRDKDARAELRKISGT